MEEAPALDLQDVSISFPAGKGRVKVVSEVSLRIDRGAILGLVGESGSGKSVTALAILGLIAYQGGRLESGTIRLHGREISNLRGKELSEIRGRQISMIFQEPMSSLNPAFTIGQQLEGVIRRHLPLNRRQARQKSVNLLDRVGIASAKSRVDDYPHQFSGGMRQRALIAMALACNPSVLIADEPTTALDVTIQARILDLLRGLQEELGMAMMFVSHDLGVVAQLCDNVAVMYAGSIVEYSNALGLFDGPQHPYTEGLLRSQPFAAPRGRPLPSIPGDVPLPGSWPEGCRFSNRCAHAVEACESPSAWRVKAVTGGRSVRCLRSEELNLDGTQ